MSYSQYTNWSLSITHQISKPSNYNTISKLPHMSCRVISRIASSSPLLSLFFLTNSVLSVLFCLLIPSSLSSTIAACCSLWCCFIHSVVSPIVCLFITPLCSHLISSPSSLVLVSCTPTLFACSSFLSCALRPLTCSSSVPLLECLGILFRCLVACY